MATYAPAINHRFWLTVPLALLGAIFVYPLGFLVWHLKDANIWTHTVDPFVLHVIYKTSKQALLASLMSFAFALPLGFIFSRYYFWGKLALRILLTLPFTLPTVAVAAGFKEWLPESYLQLLLAHVFYNTCLAFYIFEFFFEGFPEKQILIAKTLGANRMQVFKHVIWPSFQPFLLAALALVFIFNFKSFGLTLLLGGGRYTTLEVEIYKQVTLLFNLDKGAALALLQLLLLGLVLLFKETRLLGSPGPAQTRRKLSLPLLGQAICIFSALFYLSPLLVVFKNSLSQTGPWYEHYRNLFASAELDLQVGRAIGNSLLLAFASATINSCLATLSAYALSKLKMAQKLLSLSLVLPLAFSSQALALSIFLSFYPLFSQSFHITLLIPLVHSIFTLPFSLGLLVPAFSKVCKKQRLVAYSLGASSWQAFWHMERKVIAKPIKAAFVFTFLFSLGEFGVSAVLYNPQFPTLPMSIYQALSYPTLDAQGQAMALSCLLISSCVLGTLLIWRLQPNIKIKQQRFSSESYFTN